jgi:hypothetical protein
LSVASRRESAGRTLEINLVIVDQAEIYDDEIFDTVDRMESLFAGAGVTVGDIWLYEVSTPWGSVIDFDSDEPAQLRSIELDDVTTNSITVFLIDSALEGGLYGTAGGVPGAIAVHGTGSSGVIVVIDTHLLSDRITLNTQELAQTIGHEIGHQLGLFHTTEADGSDHDVLTDTPECPLSQDFDGDGTLTAEECRSHAGDHVMFWTSASFTQRTWSSQQRDVFARSPIMQF